MLQLLLIEHHLSEVEVKHAHSACVVVTNDIAQGLDHCIPALIVEFIAVLRGGDLVKKNTSLDA
jgi:hypothetical protein